MNKCRRLIALFIWLSIFNSFVSVVAAQRQEPQPIQITFGQPNIWSLEQAHYLLSQMRERNLGIKSRKLDRLDPNSPEGTRINLIRQLFQLSGEFKQSPSLSNPAASPSPTATPLQTPVPFPSPGGNSPNQFETSVLGELLKDKEFRSNIYGDSKLNATTELDNHIQLQYEIIAKQLTLLRDEVGPGERLVFLELPQSIYASAKNTDGKIAQTYWEIAGYSKPTDFKLFAQEDVDLSNKNKNENPSSKVPRTNQEVIEELLDASTKTNKKTGKVEIKSAIQNGAAPEINQANSRYTLVRAVDVIPRQSSLNVTDLQETVKSSILSGAFSWLFGLGLRTSYQHQRDTFEQYLHQETYASGFGKGQNQFGWTFGAVPGTKRIAPGIRTTYAVLIVPKEAEALILNARGCYFPRKNYQPENAMDDNSLQNWTARNKRQCSSKEQFLIPIPNGGDRLGLWATKIDYSPVKKGKRLVASINGYNFSSQVGILVNGVPLQQVVELTKKLGDDELLKGVCDEGICGSYEVIDSNELTFVFKMPDDFEEIPEITLIGPGRSVSINNIDLSKITVGDKVFKNTRLSDKKIPFMFGVRPGDPNAKLNLSKMKFFPDNSPRPTSALLTGTKFTEFDQVIVNGVQVPSTPLKSTEHLVNIPAALSSTLTDTVTVSVTRCNDSTGKAKGFPCDAANNEKLETETSVFQVPTTQFTITRVLPISYDKTRNEMFISVEGSGLEGVSLSKVNGKAPVAESSVIPVSSRAFLVKIMQPESVVKITLTNLLGTEINAVVVRPTSE